MVISFPRHMLAGPQYKASFPDPQPNSDRDSPTLPGQAEEDDDDPEEKGDDSVTDDMRQDDARSSCFSQEVGSESG